MISGQKTVRMEKLAKREEDTKAIRVNKMDKKCIDANEVEHLKFAHRKERKMKGEKEEEEGVRWPVRNEQMHAICDVFWEIHSLLLYLIINAMAPLCVSLFICTTDVCALFLFVFHSIHEGCMQ